MLGRLPFVGRRLFAELVAEAEHQRPDGEPGTTLARLAVSRQLREAVSGALEQPVTSTLEALYQYHASVPPHRDKPGWDVTLHMVVSGRGSVLRLFDDSGGAVVAQFVVEPGECVALWGREVLHGWGPVDEGRVLATIGFRPVSED